MAFLDISNGLRVNGQFPLDSRVVAANEAARYAIPDGAVYEGLVVYEESTKKLFVLDDISQKSFIDGWTEVGSGGSAGVPETSYFQSGAGGSLNETLWIGTKQQYDARTDAQKGSETIHYITDDLTLVTGAGENTNTYLLSDFGITSTADQIDHAAQQLDGVMVSDFVSADSTNVFTNKSGAISQWTNDAGYLTSQISHSDIVDSNSTVTVNADTTQVNGGSVDENGNLTVNIDLPELSTLLTRTNIQDDDFAPTGVWDFRNGTLLANLSAMVTKASIDDALDTDAQDPNRYYSSNNGGSWDSVQATIPDASIAAVKLDADVNESLDLAESALQALPTVELSNLSTPVQTSLGRADSALQSIEAASITETELNTTVNASLDKADSALQNLDGVQQFAKDTTTRLGKEKLPEDTVYDADLSSYATSTDLTYTNLSTTDTNWPTTTVGYGITDALAITNINSVAEYEALTFTTGQIAYFNNITFIGNVVTYAGTDVPAPVFPFTFEDRFIGFWAQDQLGLTTFPAYTGNGSSEGVTATDVEVPLTIGETYFTSVGDPVAVLTTDGTFRGFTQNANVIPNSGANNATGVTIADIGADSYLYDAAPVTVNGLGRFNGTQWEIFTSTLITI